MATLRFTPSAIVVASFTAFLGCADAFNPDALTVPSDDSGASTEADAGPQVSDDGATPSVGPEMTGLHVVKNQIQTTSGQPVVLHGVNRSGTEYQCSKGAGIFDGASDEASVRVIVSWKASSVRIPLNESCWLAIPGPPANPSVPAPFSGDNYKNAIKTYVALLHKYHIVPILELHWVGPGATLALRQQPMPDADHAPAFWADVTTTFKDDDGVLFEPYNEPFPDSNMESTLAWQCWRDGHDACSANGGMTINAAGGTMTYIAAGMQDLVNAIRQAEQATMGVTHVILLGGIEYSNDLRQWLQYEPTDPVANLPPGPQLGAAWHVYNFNLCNGNSCWDGAPAAVAAAVPLVATEIGEDDCKDALISPLMQWLDMDMSASAGRMPSSYLAWSWNISSNACVAKRNPYSLITDYGAGTPNSTYAKTYHDHIAGF